MSSIWKDQTLADAFMQKAMSLGVKLFPETALELAGQVRKESEEDKVLPLKYFIKQKADQTFSANDETKKVASSVSDICAAYDSIFKKYADQNGEIGAGEIDEFVSAIQHEIFIPFKRLEPKITATARSFMDKLKKIDEERTTIDKDWEHIKAAADKSLDAWQADPTNGSLRADYAAHRLGLKRIASRMQSAILEYNSIHAILIFLNRTESKISGMTRKYTVQSILSKSGASAMFKKLGLDIKELQSSLVAMRKAMYRGDLAIYLQTADKTGKELHNPLDMIRLQRGSDIDVNLSLQNASISPDTSEISEDVFFNSSAWEVHKELLKRELTKKNRTSAEIDNAIEQESRNLKYKIKNINSLPNTWQKMQQMFLILDPPTERTFQDIYTASSDSPLENIDKSSAATSEQGEKDAESLKKNRWYEVSKKQPAEWSAKDIDVVNDRISTKKQRKWGETRKYAEASNPNAHHSILWAMADMNGAVERDVSGETGGSAFIRNLKLMKEKDPNLNIDDNTAKRLAAKYDKQLWTQRRNIALQIALNPGTPDWILMYLTSVYPMGVTGPEGSRESKEVNKAFRIVREVAYEMLIQRGWKLIENRDGSIKSHETVDVSGTKAGSYGYEFERTEDYKQKQAAHAAKLEAERVEQARLAAGDVDTDGNVIQNVVSSIFGRIVTADANIDSIDQQMASKQQQIQQLEAQISPLKQQIKVLNDNKKVLVEEQKRAQQGQAQPAQPAAGSTSPSGPATTGAPTSAKYKVIYKRAAKY